MVRIMTPDNKQVMQVNAIRDVRRFTCDTHCTNCRVMFNKCTECESGYMLSGDSCVLKTVHD